MFLAGSTPLFMTNAFANFFLFLMLTGIYGFLLIAGIVGIGTFFQDQYMPWFEVVKKEYEERALIEKQKELEAVDDILLKDK